MYNEFMTHMLPILATALGAVLTALAGYVITYINKKNKSLQSDIDSVTAKKYMDMVTATIEKAVVTTNQQYVDDLKKQNAFTKESQEIAFKKTLNTVLELLSDDVMLYLNEITKDVTKYLTVNIEDATRNAKYTY